MYINSQCKIKVMGYEIKKGAKFQNARYGTIFQICKVSDKSVWTEDPNRPGVGPWRESIKTFTKSIEEKRLIPQPAQ